MSWEDRLRQAAYTSPSGVRLEFQFENVRHSFDKHTSLHNFVDVDGTYVQDNGRGGRRHPMRIFLWGTNYDLAANQFEAMLAEVGTGKLEHPIYGVVDVVPVGSIGRRDDLKTAANQAVFQFTFFETIGFIYPTTQGQPSNAVQAAVDAYNAAAAEQFAAAAQVETASDRVDYIAKFENYYETTVESLRQLAAEPAEVRSQFESVEQSINATQSQWAFDRTTLASQASVLIQAAGRASTSFETRLDAYRNLLSGITDGDSNVIQPGEVNRFVSADLFASGHVSAMIVSNINTQFSTRVEAISAAADLLDQFDKLVNWRDTSFNTLGEIDTGEAYQQLQEAVAVTAGFLVEISFSLKQEKTIVLDRNRTILDLVSELYGTLDDQLDFLITSNDLSGSEILELPRGRQIVYYV